MSEEKKPASRIWKTAGILLTIILLIAVLAIRLLPEQTRPTNPTSSDEQSSSMLDFRLRDIDGNTIALQDYRGKPVVLLFWTTWCPSCQAATGELVSAQEQLGDRAQVLGINLTLNERTTADVRRYAQENALNFPVLLELTGSLPAKLGIRGVPTIFFLATDGSIQLKHTGGLRAADVIRAVEQLIPE